MGPTDAELVQRCRRGDRPAFAELVRRHGPRAVAIARSVAGAASGEDAAQEALLRAWTNLDFLVDPSKFGAWLARIAFAAAVDHLRRSPPPAEPLPEVADPAPLPDEALSARRLEAQVMAAIAALPERYRRPLVLYHLEGLRHDRIAAELGVPAGTVRSLTTRARAALQKELAMTSDDDALFAAAPRRLLHVANGDCTSELLERSGLPGRFVFTADILEAGPCPPVDGPAWWDIRARYLGDAGARSQLEAWDRALDDAPSHDETILWFEHDLFDQLLLIRVLARFAERPPPNLTWIVIGEHPAVPGFKGLGQLTPDQLASLYETRAPVDPAALALGRDVWAAYRAPDPRRMERFLTGDLSPIPFLARALRRHLEQYPWVSDGLTRDERQLLQLVQGGTTDPMVVWRELQALEDCHFISDLQLAELLRSLVAPPAPLLASEASLALTPLGADVLAGRADRLRTAGIDRWMGGVHLGAGRIWRWDPVRGCLRREMP